ncbi:MAG: BrnA antitoxin family protein [Betaproteobacteria bacterium]
MIASPEKTRITIMLDDDIIETFNNTAESSGRDYQILINEALRQALDPESAPVKLCVVSEKSLMSVCLLD